MMKPLFRHTLLSPAAWTWLALSALSLLSVFAAGQAHPGTMRLTMTVAVAALAWIKAQLLLHHYLEAQRAGPVFSRLLQGFAALVPLGLVLSSLREWMLSW